MRYEAQRIAEHQNRLASHQSSYLVSDNGLLDSSQVLKGREQDMSPLRSANILDKVTQLFAEGNKNLILVLDGFWYHHIISKVVLSLSYSQVTQLARYTPIGAGRGMCRGGKGSASSCVVGKKDRGTLTVEKRDQLITSAVRAKREGNGRESMDGIEAKENIVVLFASNKRLVRINQPKWL